MTGENEMLLRVAAIVLREGDDVAVARKPIAGGTTLVENGVAITLPRDVPAGHKIALRPVRTGDPVHRYGQIIGYATADIAAGEWVHTRKLGFGSGEGEGKNALHLDYEYSTAVPHVHYYPPEQQRTFPGYLRPDGARGHSQFPDAGVHRKLRFRRRAGHFRPVSHGRLPEGFSRRGRRDARTAQNGLRNAPRRAGL